VDDGAAGFGALIKLAAELLDLGLLLFDDLLEVRDELPAGSRAR
jgi:hypothetical protein